MRSPLIKILYVGVVSTGLAASGPSLAPRSTQQAKTIGAAHFEGRSFAFIENRGQFDSEVKFQARSGSKILWFTSKGIVFDVIPPATQEKSGFTPVTFQTKRGRDDSSPNGERLVFRETFGTPGNLPKIEPSSVRPGVYNYFFGNDPAKWRTGIVSYSQLLYREVWPGIDIRFVANGSDIEEEFLVHPGADTASIHVQYLGVEGLESHTDGSMAVQTKFGKLRESALRIYQDDQGHRSAINGRYLISGLSYTFEVGSYNKHQQLVIDPTLLFSTYIGAGGIDSGNGIAVDSSGNTYIAGTTTGPSATPYPTTTGAFQATPPTASSAVVSRFDPLGNLAYSTYLGSPSGGDHATGIAVDSSGNAIVTGVANSGFPTTTTAFQQVCGDTGFLAKLNSNGTGLLYSTCLGSPASEYGIETKPNGVALDSSGRAYLTGSTSDSNFPVTSTAVQSALTDQSSAFVSIVDSSLAGNASLVYSTHLGGEVQDAGQAIAVDSFGNAYVTGYTLSSHFPVTAHAFQTADGQSICTTYGRHQCPTGFVAKLNPKVTGSGGLLYSTYLGGNVGLESQYEVGDYPNAIAVDSSGEAYVGGNTTSSNFPTTKGAIPSCLTTPSQNGSLGFVSKISAGGSSLVYSTFLPIASANGCGYNPVSGIALSSAGNAYVVGYTEVNGIATTTDAFQPNFGGGNFDGFLTEFSASGASVVYSTYLGGGGDDRNVAVALDAAEDAYVVGQTSSYNFPVTPFAFQPTLATDLSCLRPGGFCQDTFVTKFPLNGSGTLSIMSIEPVFGGNAGMVTPMIVGSGFHAGATAKLNCGGQTTIGSNIVFGSLGRTLHATFDLSSVTAGKCDVVITNPDATSATLPQAFTVQQGGAPNIDVSVIGVAVRQAPDEIADAPINAIFAAVVDNRGSVDSLGGVLSLPLGSSLVGTSSDPPDLAPQGSAIEIWAAPSLAGSKQRFVATATTDNSSAISTTAGVDGLGSVHSQITIPITDCSKLDFGVKACHYERVTNWIALDACIVKSNAFRSCGAEVVGCIVKSKCTSLPCVGACLLAGGLTCPIAGWPDVSSCIDSTSSLKPVCKDVPLRCFAPMDPNSLTGPSGVESRRWISSAQPLTYLITFENKPDATAPAQKVIVTQPLPDSLDLNKLELLTLTVPNGTSAIPINIPAGSFDPLIRLNEFATNVDLRPTQNLLVNVDAKLDALGRSLLWTFTTIDPSTSQPPLDPLVGFLPAGSSGSVAFSVMANSPVATGTQITDQATILFIGSSPMTTPAWINTIDDTPPASRVGPLPATENSSTFAVVWSGTDAGSGIHGYTIYVSDNGGTFEAWQTNTTSITATYSGASGHTYSFYSIATDLVGNSEALKTTAEATTTVRATSNCATDVSSQVTITRGGFRYNHVTKSFVQTVSLRNNGTSLTGVSLVLDSVSAAATFTGAGGMTTCAAPLGSPWVSIPGTLASGQSISLTLTFSDPTQGSIQYVTRVLAGGGQN